VLLVLGLAAARPVAALEAGKRLSQYVLDVWQEEKGLPQDTVQAVLRGRDGYLWLGTQEGLVRFDGARFTVFDGKTTPLLATGSAFALMEDRHGALWIGRSENVLKYEKGVFTKVLGSDELGQGTVWALAEAPDGTVWAGAGRGLVRFRDGKATLLTKEDGIPAARLRTICVEKNGYSRTKLLVPSIGSTSHRYSESALLRPVSSPKKPCSGGFSVSTLSTARHTASCQ